MQLKEFEFKVIETLLNDADLLTIFNDRSKEYEAKIEETGYGYYLTILDSKLPQERAVYSQPFLIGKTNDNDSVKYRII